MTDFNHIAFVISAALRLSPQEDGALYPMLIGRESVTNFTAVARS